MTILEPALAHFATVSMAAQTMTLMWVLAALSPQAMWRSPPIDAFELVLTVRFI